MKNINYTTTATTILADTFTPVSIYLRIRDTFRDSVLLESNQGNDNDSNCSFIGINAIAGIEMINKMQLEYRMPNSEAKILQIEKANEAINFLQKFMECFISNAKVKFPLTVAQGLIGSISYDAVQLFENIEVKTDDTIPLLRFRFYQYIIAIDHYKDELHIIENNIDGIESKRDLLETLLYKKDVPSFPFSAIGNETSNCTDELFLQNVENGIHHCKVGDVFQVVLSRSFMQPFNGDDFNVYRQLRSINPSPYLFYFDYGNYKLMGSSPESQLIIDKGVAYIHPIAGTIKKTGSAIKDEELANKLINDAKENAEHTMLVDLARNDLSIFCNKVSINYYKKLKHFSHLMHLVSEVQGNVLPKVHNTTALGKSFPAGTLSGAPKYKAMQIINTLETTPRGFYGGAIGFLGFDGSCNMAIMIRTFKSSNNVLQYQAGAGVVAASIPKNELIEVNNKVAALRTAVQKASETN
jgi:anthranilate synthase component I